MSSTEITNREVTSMITISGEELDARGTLNITPSLEDRQAIVFVQVDGQSAAWRMTPDALFALATAAKDAHAALVITSASQHANGITREIPALDGFGGEGTLEIIVSPDLDELGNVAALSIMFAQRLCISFYATREQMAAVRDGAYAAFAALTDTDSE